MTTGDLLKQGFAALKAERNAEARSLLIQVVQQDKRNEKAWLWLSAVVDTDEERRICLENVLVINSNNGIARRGLESLVAKEGVRPLSAASSPASEAETVKDEPAALSVVETPEAVRRQAQTKKCPYCAEEIQYEAIVCRYCGRDLREEAPGQNRELVKAAKQTAKSANETATAVGYILMIIVFVIGLYILAITLPGNPYYCGSAFLPIIVLLVSLALS